MERDELTPALISTLDAVANMIERADFVFAQIGAGLTPSRNEVTEVRTALRGWREQYRKVRATFRED